MYVERGGDGRERFYDPMNYIPGIMQNGAWPGSWKSPQEWTTRDYDRLGDIMTEWLNRQRGRQMGGFGGHMPWMTGDNYRGPSFGRYGSYGTPWGPDMARMMNRVEEMADSYKAHLRDLNDKLYGSEEDRREERWRERQFKLWREFQNMTMNNGAAGMNGMPPMNVPMPGMMGQNLGMPGMGVGPGGMLGMGGGLGGMGMNGIMPGAGLGGMNGFGNDMYGGGLGSRRRGKPFRDRGRGRFGDLGLEDELDDDFGGGLRGRRGFFGGGREMRDDDGVFGGFGDGE